MDSSPSPLPSHGVPNQTLLGTLRGSPTKLTTNGRAFTRSPANTPRRNSSLPTTSVSPVLSVFASAGGETASGLVTAGAANAACISAELGTPGYAAVVR